MVSKNISCVFLGHLISSSAPHLSALFSTGLGCHEQDCVTHPLTILKEVAIFYQPFRAPRLPRMMPWLLRG